MKTFKIKDLTVSIGAQDAALAPGICRNPTILCHYSFGCDLQSFQCPGNSYLCHFPTNHCAGCSIFITRPCACTHIASIPDITEWITTTPIQTGIDQLQEIELTELKKNLAELQKAVDIKLQRSPEELEELETKLNEALTEVRAQRGNVKGK